jgi:hypothetical protein
MDSGSNAKCPQTSWRGQWSSRRLHWSAGCISAALAHRHRLDLVIIGPASEDFEDPILPQCRHPLRHGDRQGRALLSLNVPLEPTEAYKLCLTNVPAWSGLQVQEEVR